MGLDQPVVSSNSWKPHFDRGNELADAAEAASRRGDLEDERRLHSQAAEAQETALSFVNAATQKVTYGATALSTAVLWERACDLPRARRIAEQALRVPGIDVYYTSQLREIAETPDNANWAECHEQSEVLAAAAQRARMGEDDAEALVLSARAAEYEERALSFVQATDGNQLVRYGATALNLVGLWQQGGDCARARSIAERVIKILEPESEKRSSKTLSEYTWRLRDLANLYEPDDDNRE